MYSLIIRTDKNILDEIATELAFNGSKMIRKGSFLNRITGKSKINVYKYEKSYEDDEELSQLSSFLDEIIDRKYFIEKYAKNHIVVIRLFFQSSQSQMYFLLNPSIIEKLNTIGLPVELSILSWGQILG